MYVLSLLEAHLYDLWINSEWWFRWGLNSYAFPPSVPLHTDIVSIIVSLGKQGSQDVPFVGSMNSLLSVFFSDYKIGMALFHFMM